MSKQSEAKAKQGYIAKVVPQTCSGCAHFTSEKIQKKGYFGGVYIDEKNLRCGIGGFAVKRMGACKEWAEKLK